MNAPPMIIYVAELALAAIILFYVFEMLTIPSNIAGLSGFYYPDFQSVRSRAWLEMKETNLPATLAQSRMLN
jgi:hypothetical protein